jgi:hypothetical protein
MDKSMRKELADCLLDASIIYEINLMQTSLNCANDRQNYFGSQIGDIYPWYIDFFEHKM